MSSWDESGTYRIELGDAMAAAMLRAAMLDVARDLLATMDVSLAREILVAALAEADLTIDADELIDELLSGPTFTGSEELDANDRVVARRGTLTYPDGTEHYIIERADGSGELQTLLDYPILGPRWMGPDDLAQTDWSAVAADLKQVVRELWPAVTQEDSGYPPLPSDALALARHATGGPEAVLADIAETIRSWDDTSWDAVDHVIDAGVRWAMLLEDSGEVYRVGELVRAGYAPDPAALEALRRGSDAPDVVEPARYDPDRPDVGEVFTMIPGERATDRALRAANELGLPTELVAWAHTGNGLGSAVSIDGRIWLWTRYGPAMLDGHSGELLETKFVRDAPAAHDTHAAGDLILVDTYRSLLAFDTANWAFRWEVPASEGIRADNSRVMVRDGGHLVADATSITCVDLATGIALWTYHGRGRRPGLWPMGFVGGLALLGRRDDSAYSLVMIDVNGVEAGAWEVDSPEGRVIGDWVVLWDEYTHITELLNGQPIWRPRPLPVAEADGFVWADNGDHASRIGAGSSEAPAWIEQVAVSLDLDPMPLSQGWVPAAGRSWARDRSGSWLIGVGQERGDIILQELPLMFGRPIATGSTGVVVHSQGRSGGYWLTCLRADRLGNR